LLSDVPNFDIIIPTARDQHVFIFLVELNSEHSVVMSGFSSATTSQLDLDFPRKFVIDSDNAVTSSCCEESAVWLVVDTKELIQLIMDCIKKFATCGVPVL
jgi:hypothetical protein